MKSATISYAIDVRLLVIGIIVIFGVMTVAAVGIFVYSLWKQFKYSKAALPSLEVETVEEEVEESAFEIEALPNDFVNSSYNSSRLPDEVSYEELVSKKYETSLTDEDEDEEEIGLPPLQDFALPLPDEPMSEDLPSESPVAPDATVMYDEDEEDDFTPVIPKKEGSGKHRAPKPNEEQSKASSGIRGLRRPKGIMKDEPEQTYTGRRRASTD